MRSAVTGVAMAVALMGLSACDGLAPGNGTAEQTGAVEIIWEDLMPPGEMEHLDRLFANQMAQFGDVEEGSAADAMVQIGTFNVVDDLDGQKIRLPGFMVPFDLTPERQVESFLLVPYFGACIHVPPPPPNQVVFIDAAEPVDFTWDPVWVEGTLTTERNMNDVGNAAYTLRLDKLELYTY